jgi:serine/threonine-protein kinase
MISTHPESAPVAIQAISKLDDKSTIKPLLKLLSKSRNELGKDILSAISALTDEENLPTVKTALQKIAGVSGQDFRDLASSTLKSIISRLDGKTSEEHDDQTVLDKSTELVDMSQTATSSDFYADKIIDASKLEPGQMLADRYKIIRQIGKGAFGVVVLVNDTMVNEDIILKFLNPHMASDESVIQRFIHELRYARKITHENVIRIYDFITFGRSYAISMEYFSSHSLAYEIKTKKTRDYNRIKRIFCDICKAMTVAHNAGVIHRDLKPANILVGENDLVKIVDFGLAAAASQSDTRLTKSGILVGTPTYMAPEQVRARAIDARTDIYSLGILMYEMFTGRPPYKGEDHMATLFKHVEGNAKPANQINPEISDELNTIVMKAIATNPDDRFQSVAQLQSELENILNKEAA